MNSDSIDNSRAVPAVGCPKGSGSPQKSQGCQVGPATNRGPFVRRTKRRRSEKAANRPCELSGHRPPHHRIYRGNTDRTGSTYQPKGYPPKDPLKSRLSRSTDERSTGALVASRKIPEPAISDVTECSSLSEAAGRSWGSAYHHRARRSRSKA